jgi:hypothetical protein
MSKSISQNDVAEHNAADKGIYIIVRLHIVPPSHLSVCTVMLMHTQ